MVVISFVIEIEIGLYKSARMSPPLTITPHFYSVSPLVFEGGVSVNTSKLL